MAAAMGKVNAHHALAKKNSRRSFRMSSFRTSSANSNSSSNSLLDVGRQVSVQEVGEEEKGGVGEGEGGNAEEQAPDNELFVPDILKLLCKVVEKLGGFDGVGIFRKAGSKTTAELIRKTISKGDYSILLNVLNESDAGVGGGGGSGGGHARSNTTTSTVSSRFSSTASLNSNASRKSNVSSASGKSRHAKVRLRDADVAADILKQWLRAMPEPLIAYNTYNDAIEAGSQKSLEQVLQVLQRFNTERRQTLMYLLNFLRTLAKEEPTTKMGASQLAIVFMVSVLLRWGKWLLLVFIFFWLLTFLFCFFDVDDSQILLKVQSWMKTQQLQL
jgi:hypothetical protein